MVADWNGQERHSDDRLTDCSIQKFKTRVNGFFDISTSGVASSSSSKTSGSLVKSREANKKVFLAIDNAMQACLGFGFAAYLPTQRVGRLQSYEDRFFIPQTEMPDHLRFEFQQRTRRSCINDTRTNSTRLEVLWDSDTRPSLFRCTDQGSVGWPTNYYLYEKVGIRGSYQHDEPHRRHNNFTLAVKQSGLWWVTLEFNVVINFLKGPWGKSAHFSTVREAALEFFASFGHDNKLFSALYEWICLDLNHGEYPPDMASEEHRAELWSSLKNLPIFKSAGPVVRVSRWFQWNTRFEQMRPYLSVLLMVCIYIAVTRGSFKSISDIPGLCSLGSLEGMAAGLQPGPGQDAPADQAANLARHNVRNSNATVEKMRRLAGGSTMAMVINILSNRPQRRVGTALLRLSEPIKELHSQQIVKAKTQSGTMEWYATSASGSPDAVLVTVWRMLSDSTFLALVEMRRCEEILSDAMYLEDKLVADCVVDICRRLCFNELLSNSFWTMRPFGRLAQACHDTPAEREKLLPWCRQIWDSVIALEAAADRNPELNKFWKALLWPAHCWVREAFVAMAETEWTCVPPSLLRELKEVPYSNGFDCKDSECAIMFAGVCA